MKLFFIFFLILLIFFIPIPIKFSIYYSSINYYVKLYGFTIISKKNLHIKKNIIIKLNLHSKKNINFFQGFIKI